MAAFQHHVTQAKRNLSFLQTISGCSDYYDWQVTVCYYAALHLVNAHLANYQMHFNSHSKTRDALNFERELSLPRIDETPYKDYLSLENLSRRARYLSHEKEGNDPIHPFLIYEKHLAKAIRKLNTLMLYFGEKYSLDFLKQKVTCPKIKMELKSELAYFEF